MFDETVVNRRWSTFLSAAMCLFLVTSLASAGLAVEFLHALDDSPLDLSALPNETFSAAVISFQQTGVNPYHNDPQALAAGKILYQANCQVCHLPDGSGKLGPSLISDETLRPRVGSDVGMFEVIHSGAAGAMRSFSKRGMTQDQMLQLIAYVRSLKPK